MADIPAAVPHEGPTPIADRRMNWRRPLGLAMMAITVFMLILICTTIGVDLARTKERRTIMYRDQTYSVWISSERQGYYLKMRNGTQSGSALIATEADLAGSAHDYVIEWNPDQARIIGRIGSCRGTIILH